MGAGVESGSDESSLVDLVSDGKSSWKLVGTRDQLGVTLAVCPPRTHMQGPADIGADHHAAVAGAQNQPRCCSS